MKDLQLFTAYVGAIVLTISFMLAAIEALRIKNRQLRQELRQQKAENARLRSLLQLSDTERDILMGQMELDKAKHMDAVALMAHEAGERYKTKDLLLRQKWQEVVG